MTPKQKKIASKAPPRNKIDGKDFAVLRQEKAKGRGMGLQDEKMKPGKIMKADKGTSVKISGEKLSLDKALRMQKEGKINPKTGKFTSLDALREAKGFKPGEKAKDFMKRRMELGRAKEAIRATRIGKIDLPIALAGVGAVQYLKSKMKKKKEKKMGGGMMMKKPMMENKGVMAKAGKTGYKKLMEQRAKDRITDRDKARAKDITKGMGAYMGGGLTEATQKLKAQGKMGGGMMQRPMMAMGGGMMPGYKKGKSVMAKGCKLGRKKPTKMYT